MTMFDLYSTITLIDSATPIAEARMTLFGYYGIKFIELGRQNVARPLARYCAAMKAVRVIRMLEHEI